MGGNVVAHKRSILSGPKVKTGCTTCRIRKVKCDESKPFCQKCVSTGRACDGYKSPFKLCTSQPIINLDTGGSMSNICLQPTWSTLTSITPQEVELLNRYFSVKTIFNVNLGCDEEARQVLKASLIDPPIRHAISSLIALRKNFEMSRDIPTSVMQQHPSYRFGLQQYSVALKGLASNLSSLGSQRLRSALLCCQVFISIEQVQRNYAAMAQHIIRGLRIMHQYRARPEFTATKKVVPAHHDQLPFLDVFVIKLFATPCKFAEPPVTTDVSGTAMPVCAILPRQQPVETRDFRTIAPDMRTELIKIATSTLKFLGRVSQVDSAGNALGLLSEKAALLESLESWLTGLEAVQAETGSLRPEPISVSFMRLFHPILKIVLLGALDSPPDFYVKLQTENERLLGVANSVSERLKAYSMRS